MLPRVALEYGHTRARLLDELLGVLLVDAGQLDVQRGAQTEAALGRADDLGDHHG